MEDRKIWTIGHSTRPFTEFVDMLKNFNIARVVDVRRYPGSKRFPQYNEEVLASKLLHHDIKYTHMEALGGRRTPLADSINTAWRSKGFRGYADYMDTLFFQQAIMDLEKMANEEFCAYLCSEAVWWSCHRSLISDYLKVRGWDVNHIMDKHKSQQHPYTRAASIKDGRLSYREALPGANPLPGELF